MGAYRQVSGKAGHPADLPVKCYNRYMKKILLWMVLLLFTPLSLSCFQKALPRWVSLIQEITVPVGSEEIFRLPEGEKRAFSQLLEELDGPRVIFVGESHDQIEHHRIQVSLLQNSVAQGKEIAIGMEMFEKSNQPILDRWSQGFMAEDEFLKETNWDLTWRMDYNLYKGILDEAKKHRLKLIGLNVQRDLVRKVAEQGIEGLSLEDRVRLPEMDLSDRAHRAYIRSVYKDHQEGSARDFERFYQAQCLWDEGMAETLSEFLRLPENREKVVFVFAGSGHVIFDFGIPKRFFRRTPLPFKTLILKERKNNIGEDPDIRFASMSQPLGDYLWITQPNPPEIKRPRIGVVLKEVNPSTLRPEGQGLLRGDPEPGFFTPSSKTGLGTAERAKDLEGLQIERVIPGSPAEKAGLLAGDELLTVEGRGITKVKDIHDAVIQKGWTKDITFTILREGMKRDVTVTLPTFDE